MQRYEQIESRTATEDAETRAQIHRSTEIQRCFSMIQLAIKNLHARALNSITRRATTTVPIVQSVQSPQRPATMLALDGLSGRALEMLEPGAALSSSTAAATAASNHNRTHLLPELSAMLAMIKQRIVDLQFVVSEAK